MTTLVMAGVKESSYSNAHRVLLTFWSPSQTPFIPFTRRTAELTVLGVSRKSAGMVS
jgi:hypothetical protein